MKTMNLSLSLPSTLKEEVGGWGGPIQWEEEFFLSISQWKWTIYTPVIAALEVTHMVFLYHFPNSNTRIDYLINSDRMLMSRDTNTMKLRDEQLLITKIPPGMVHALKGFSALADMVSESSDSWNPLPMQVHVHPKS